MNFFKLLVPVIFLSIISSCDATQKIPETKENISNQLNILLKNGVDPNKMEIIYKKYDLKKEKGLSFTENRWIYSFNQKLISIDDLMKELKEKQVVLDVKSYP